MDEAKHVSLIKLNSLIRQRKRSEAVQYIQTHKITRSKCLHGSFDDANTPCLSPLSLAAGEGYLDLVQILIEQGFDPHELEYNRADFEKWKPIHYACCNGHVQIVKYFIEEHGIDVESPSGLNWTLLQHALNYRHAEMTKYLVEAGASVNKSEDDYLHPLRIAVAYKEDHDICKYLISKGANVNAWDGDGLTPLFTAVYEGNYDIANLLLSAGAKTEIVSNSGDTPLSTAVDHGVTPLVKLLIANGADPESVDANGRSALHKALCERRCYNFDIVYYLVVDTGVKVSTEDNQGHSCLYVAVQAYHLDAVELLVNYGLDMKCESWLLDDDFVERNPKRRLIVMWLQDIIFRPRSLKDTCCGLIRNLLGKSLSSKVDNLPLPQTLKDYLLLRHLKKSTDR